MTNRPLSEAQGTGYIVAAVKAPPELQLQAYTQACLRSERVRITCMLAAFGLIVLVGVFRTIVPLAGSESAGLLIIMTTIPFMVYEALMLRLAAKRMAVARPLSPSLRRLSSVLECVFPVCLMATLIIMMSWSSTAMER